MALYDKTGLSKNIEIIMHKILSAKSKFSADGDYVKGSAIHSNGLSYCRPDDIEVLENNKSFVIECLAKRDAFKTGISGALIFGQIKSLNVENPLVESDIFLLGFVGIDIFGHYDPHNGFFGVITYYGMGAIESTIADEESFSYYSISYNAENLELRIYKNGAFIQNIMLSSPLVISPVGIDTGFLGADERVEEAGLNMTGIILDETYIYVYDDQDDFLTNEELDALFLKRYNAGNFYYGPFDRDNLKIGYNFDQDYNDEMAFDCSRNSNDGEFTKRGSEPTIEFVDGAPILTNTFKEEIEVELDNPISI
jgi:hypothetical protein